MGVVTCVECGSPVNEAAGRCPECGADPRTGLTEEERAATSRRAVLDPLARAKLAHEQGRRFLEVAVAFDEAELAAMRHGKGGPGVEAAAAGRADLLAAVEAEGWHLITASYLANGMRYERDVLALVEGGPVEAASVVGIYLFRAAGPDADAEDDEA